MTLTPLVKSSINKLPASRVEISGELEREAFAAYRAAALAALKADATIAGFRPGHAPESVLVERFGEDKILLDMAELALREYYPKLLAEHQLEALGRPEIVLTKLAKDNPLGFKITTAVQPEITLPDYKKLAREINVKPLESITVEEKEVKQKDKRRLEIIEAVVKETKLILPEILIESELDKMLAEMKSQIERMGLKFEEYLKHLKKEESDLRADWRGDAERRVKMALVLAEIATAEKIGAPEAEVAAEVKHLKEHYKDAPEGRLRAYVDNILTNEYVFRFLEEQKN